MTLTSLGWDDNAASDVHLIPNLSSPEFFRMLEAFDEKGEGQHAFNLSGATITFTPQLTGQPADHGLAVVPRTGEVTVQTAAVKGRSFILNVTVAQGGASASSRLRIHVHNAVQRIWVTPQRLTVRHGASGVRFSVLAQFDDGVIGDISNWSPFLTPGGPVDHTYVHAPGSDTPALSWSSSGAPVTVDGQTGVLAASADAGQSQITVRFGALSATATATCAPPWNTTVKLDLAGGPGLAQAPDVPNILFLPDGFQEADRAQYERDVRLIVTRLRTRNRTRPYAALADRINYWRAWLPSPEAGVTVLNEVQPVPARRKGDVDQAFDVPLPSLTRPALGWSLPQLLNAVGLPNPTADHPGDPLDPKRAEWKALYGDFTAAQVGRAYPQWLAISDRLLVNERDTALHMAFSERPALAGVNSGMQELTLNPRRVSPNDFNAMLDALRAGPNGDQAVGGGKLWTTGKDRRLVVVLCRSSHVGGVHAERLVQNAPNGSTIGVSLARRSFHQVRSEAGGNGFDLVPDTIPDDVFYAVWLTVAHELGHAFELGDEYGGNADPPTAADISDSAHSPNIQDRASALDPSGHLDVTRLKWADWPRIAKAGVLAGQPVEAGGRLTVSLVNAKRSGLRTGDVVKFRRRPLATAGATSDVCQILSVDLTSNVVIVNPLFGGTVKPTDFPAGSILLAFVRQPDPDFEHNKFGGLLTLVDQNVLQRIGVTGNPLNAAPTDVPDRPDPNKELDPPVAATNFDPGTKPASPPFSSWIVGAFENGHTHNTGFYHPTGVCLMSSNSKIDRTTKQLNLYDFCIICRYAFVDAVDPTLHGEVEQDFRERYGKRGAQ